MIIHQINLNSFRNHRELVYTPGEGVNIICGQNGRGKTNLLEGIFLLTGAKSWRAASRQELVMWGESGGQVKAKVESRSRDFELALDIPLNARARAKINGINASRENPLAGVLRAVLFSPEDLSLIKGPPSARRELMDSSLSQLWPRYAPLLSRYTRLVLSKGKLLRMAQATPHMASPYDILPEINSQIASLGAKIIRFRANFCKALNESAAKVHAEISSGTESLRLEYRTASSVTDMFALENEIERALLEHILQRESAEKASATCLVGPHRDDIEITINGRAARSFASQGQARSAALALRFAQRELFFADLKEYPLLLLDDILSELDEQRRDFVCRAALGGQIVITCCNAEKGFANANVTEI